MAKGEEYRQSLKLHEAKIEERVKMLETQKREVAEKRVWIKNWLKRRRKVEASLKIHEDREVEKKEFYNRMRQDLKEMKIEMGLVQREITQEVRQLKREERDIMGEKEKIRKELEELKKDEETSG